MIGCQANLMGAQHLALGCASAAQAREENLTANERLWRFPIATKCFGQWYVQDLDKFTVYSFKKGEWCWRSTSTALRD